MKTGGFMFIINMDYVYLYYTEGPNAHYMYIRVPLLFLRP